MTLFLDTSALVKRYVDEDGSGVVIASMNGGAQWCASALALTEAQISLCHAGFDSETQALAIGALRTDWERMLIVPIDDRCLGRAREIGCSYRVRTLDAIHLAAAERLPGPIKFFSFDLRQRAAAKGLGLDLESIEPLEP